MKTIYSAEKLQKAIMKARPWNLTALILRISNMFPEIQPAFMELIGIIDELKNPADYLYTSMKKLGKNVRWYLRAIFYLAEKILPDFIMNAILRYLINVILIPYFEILDEKSFLKMKKKLGKDRTKIILDIVGEAAKTKADADRYMESYKYVIHQFGGKIAVKPSSLLSKEDFDEHNYDERKEILKNKFAELFTEIKGTGVSIILDAEEYFDWCHLTEEAFMEVADQPRFRGMTNEIGIALQAYRKDALLSAFKLLAVSRNRLFPLRIRVVKGAYWAEERHIAEERGKEFPLFEKQSDTDKMFNNVVFVLLYYRKSIFVSPASHNAKNIVEALRNANSDYSCFEFEVLNGMGESIRRALTELEVPVSVYCPLIRKGGSPKEGMKYLIRRLDEVAKSSHVLKNV